jgi:hypothetical protein
VAVRVCVCGGGGLETQALCEKRQNNEKTNEKEESVQRRTHVIMDRALLSAFDIGNASADDAETSASTANDVRWLHVH